MAIENATPSLRLCAQRPTDAEKNFYLTSASQAFEFIEEPKWADTLEAAETLAVAIAEKHGIAVLVTNVVSRVVPWFPECHLDAEGDAS